MLFLRYLDDLEHRREIQAELAGKPIPSLSTPSTLGPAGRHRRSRMEASIMITR